MPCRCRFFLARTPGNRVAQPLDHYNGLTSQAALLGGPGLRNLSPVVAFDVHGADVVERQRRQLARHGPRRRPPTFGAQVFCLVRMSQAASSMRSTTYSAMARLEVAA